MLKRKRECSGNAGNVKNMIEPGRRFICILLLISLLVASTPAAPILNGVAAWQQNPTLFMYANNWLGMLIDSFGQANQNSLPVQESQEARDVKVTRIKIQPEYNNVLVGTQIHLGAIPYAQNDTTVSGVRIEWEVEDTNGQVRPIEGNLFKPDKAGNFKIIAKGAGKRAVSHIKVIDSIATAGSPLENQKETALDTQAQQNLLLPYEDWNVDNIQYAREPRNERGSPAGKPKENSNFNIVAPVLSIPGRAGLDLELNLNYNSRVWTKMGSNISYDIDKDLPTPGWSLGFGKIINLLDGGIVQIDADGTKRFYSGILKPFESEGRKRFEGQSTDGTFIKALTTNQTSIVSGQRCYSSTSTTLRYPNGINITYSDWSNVESGCLTGESVTQVPSRISDKHGNYIDIFYHPYSQANVQSGRFIDYIKDTLGRIYIFNYTLIDGRYYLTSITCDGLKNSQGNIIGRTLVQLNYQNLNLNYQFNGLNPIVRENNLKVLSAIYYPATGTGYWFGDQNNLYYSPYGMVRTVEEHKGMGFNFSTGVISPGQVSRKRVYSYPETATTPLSDVPTFETVTETWDGMLDPSQPAITTYQVDWNSTPRTTTVIAPYQGGKTVEYSYNYSHLLESDPEKVKDGITFKTEFYDGSNTLRSKDEISWDIGYLNFPAHYGTTTYTLKIPRPSSATHSEYENGNVFTKKSIYDRYGDYNRVEEMREIGYGGETDVLRKVKTQYIDIGDPVPNDANNNYYYFWYYSHRTVNLPNIVEVFDKDDNRVDYTKYLYDQVPVKDTFPRASNGFDVIYPSNYDYVVSTSGNLSNVIRFSSITNTSLANQINDGRIYDRTGNIIEYNPSQTGAGYTTFKYTDGTGYAYPLEISQGDLNTPNLSLKTTFTYDYNTGLLLTATDPNLKTIKSEYDLYNWRMNNKILPTGGQISYSYDDANRIYTQTLFNDGQAAGKQRKHLNGLGLPYREETLSDVVLQANGQNQEIWDAVEIKYDNRGRTKKTSNPFRSSDSANGVYWSEVFYDWAGRVEKTKSPDGSEKFNYYNESVSQRPAGASTETGKTFRVKDPVGRERWHRTDSDGNIVEVIEPNPGGTGAVATGGLLTKYEYDKLGRLKRIVQGSQERKFNYDSLGRLTHQKLAETNATLDANGAFVGETSGAWSDFYLYDGMSNISSHTDARGVKTTYSFNNPNIANSPHDPLNRIFSISYNTNGATGVLSSPTARFAYQPNGDISQLKSATTDPNSGGVGTTVEFVYDSFGRIKDKTTTLSNRSGSPMSITYTYDSLSRLTDILYPQQHGTSFARKNIHYDYDKAGRMNGLKVNNSAYASDFDFNASNQIKSVKIGAAGTNQINETYDYNPQTGLLQNQKVLRGSTALLDLTYEYQRCSCSTGGTGQITKIINNLDRNKDRAYEYDALSRLKKVIGGINQGWSQTYVYDRYGNRKDVITSGVESLRTRGDVSKKDQQEKILAESLPVSSAPTASKLLNEVKSLIKDVKGNETPEKSPLSLYKQSDNQNDEIIKNDKQIVSGEKQLSEKGVKADSSKTQTSNVNLSLPIRTPFDFDGDGKADISAWRRSNGIWTSQRSGGSGQTTVQLGSSGNQIAPGDYDGDGKTDEAVWNPDNGLWTIRYSLSGTVGSQYWGTKGDAIVPADYDGDGKTDIAVWRPSTGYWYALRSSDGSLFAYQWGHQRFGDIPVVGDYDGDGKADTAVWRPSNGNWYVLVMQSGSGQILDIHWGATGDVPVPADYDGDNKTDLAVWRPADGAWYISRSSDNQFIAIQLGEESQRDIMVPADYDGDRKADVAVWRPSTGIWTIKQSTTNTNVTYQLGASGDVAVPSAYIRRSSAPRGQSVEIPRDGHASLSFEPASNRITTAGFLYDAAGNQTQIVQPDGAKLLFQYDAAGRLIKVRKDNQGNVQTVVTYTYGASRERLIAQEGDEYSVNRTYYAWEAGSVIAEYVDSVNNTLFWTKNYIYMNGALLATQENAGTSERVQFDHPDQLGTRIVTNPSDGTFFEQNTLPFGTALESESSGAINNRFTSYDRSTTTKLDYAVNRFYDSAQGRFTTVDPIKMGATNLLNPQSLNLYAYCKNDPVNRTDPFGLDDFTYSRGATNTTFLGNRFLLPGSTGSSFFSGLSAFITGFLGSLFGGDRPAFYVIRTPLNTGNMTVSAPPPLPGTGTTEFVQAPATNGTQKENPDCITNSVSDGKLTNRGLVQHVAWDYRTNTPKPLGKPSHDGIHIAGPSNQATLVRALPAMAGKVIHSGRQTADKDLIHYNFAVLDILLDQKINGQLYVLTLKDLIYAPMVKSGRIEPGKRIGYIQPGGEGGIESVLHVTLMPYSIFKQYIIDKGYGASPRNNVPYNSLMDAAQNVNSPFRCP